MKRSGTCPKCHSKRISENAKVVDRGDSDHEWEMKVAVFNRPAALLFTGKQSSTVSAWICLACGFMEFYADQPSALVTDRDR